MDSKKIAVLYHIFYEDSYKQVIQELEYLMKLEPLFFFNISSDTPGKLEIKAALLKQFPTAVISISANKGKDIGGKLILLKLCMQMAINPDWIIFLHDKKSLQALNAEAWRRSLFAIIGKEQLECITGKMIHDPNCGIIASDRYIMKEKVQDRYFIGNNGPIMNELVGKYNIECASFDYVAGTIFWAKATPLMSFFKNHDPLIIRASLEEGNVLDNFKGTHSHSWERLLSWIITSQGYSIKSV